MRGETVSVREHLEKLHEAYVSSHSREHEVHAGAHEREHALNQKAIEKAEDSVDKAVTAARETVGADLKALSDRIDHGEDEQRRKIDDIKTTITQLGLDIAGVRTTAEGNAKDIQKLQDAQSWVVRLVGAAIILALLALIFRPGVFGP